MSEAVYDADREEWTLSRETVADVVVTLTAMRGWVMAGSLREREFMGSRIDALLAVFTADDIVRQIHHDVLEGVTGPDAGDRAEAPSE